MPQITNACEIAEPDASRDWIGIFALLACIGCWGIVPVILRGLTNDIDAWTANGVRYPMAAMMYWPILGRLYFKGVLTKQILRRCIVPALFSFFGQVFWALSFYHLPANVIGFLIRSSILWTVLGGMLIFSEERRLLRRPRFYVGAIVTIGGFIALSLLRSQFVEIQPLGLFLILTCGVIFGLYAVSVRYFVHDVPSIISVGIVANFVSVGTLCMLPLGNYENLIHVSATNWLLIVLSSVLGIALGHAFLYSAVNRIGPSIAASAQSATPFLTAAIAFFFLGEELTMPQVGAGMSIVAGMIILLSVKRT